ncbi:MAG: type I restriction-modification system subunit M N-terminal domain-containing protein [Candidatus Manganitrophus sp.]|nr:MAG: type I restriction-modification system subunit M N-terminal domain-containing protein [Candidatus Manganitrophus sp.]
MISQTRKAGRNMPPGKDKKDKKSTAANLGFEAQLWQMADALRGSMDAAEYKHVALGLIFLKYISDAFEEQHAKLVAEQASRAPTPKTRTNTARRASSGCRPRRAGRT